MIAVMIYATLVGILAAIAAGALERVARWAGFPSRWVWSGAMALSLALGVRAAVQPPQRADVHGTSALPASARASVGASGEWRDVVRAAAGIVNEALDSPASIQHALSRRLPAFANAYAAVAWSAASLVLALVFAGAYRRFFRARARWPLTVLHGVPVRVAGDVGPIVVGVAHAEIVVPNWLMECSGDDQRLVVEHERAHIRAGDPLHLAIACAAVVLVPWHAPLWYMLSRLRLCIELDCDARVLKGGASSASYGALLIDVAERVSPLRLSALALTDDSSQLKRRILAMNARLPSFVLVRGAAAGAFALLVLAAACEATLPTTTQVAPRPATTQNDGSASVDPVRRGPAKPNRDVLGSSGHIAFFIDGVERDSSALANVPRDSIASVDVLKGAYMRAQYPGKDYTGVIIVKTKSAKTPD